MSQSDPFDWFTDLLKSQPGVLWSGGTGGGGLHATKNLTYAASVFAQWQRDSLQLMAPWVGAVSGEGASRERISDRRFADKAWNEDPRFELMARAYVAQVNQLGKALDAAPLDERSKAQWGFAMRQITDALSPANNLATNPEAMNLALETGGASLAEGLQLFIRDLAKGRISMTDDTAFEVGKNICTTEGSVVFQNDLIQLIQYRPTTQSVSRRPLVIVPPCINKYYILDLQPANSFVGYAVAQGQTVFLISWRNAGPEQDTLTWDDYLQSGVLRALDVALKITAADKANTLGFCVGGTMLASALAILAAHEQRAASVTLLTTMLDFTDTGEIGLLVSEEGVAAREATIGRGGLLKGSELGQVFAALRANDLIWPYVVKGYLKGQAPPAFDLLYWNSDETNLPGPMFCWYVRKTYLENKLHEPGGTVQCGEPVDLGRVDIPAFLYASRDDHIVPWKSVYASTKLLQGDKTFVLGASGHIAGVINPPAKKKRNFWVRTDPAAYDVEPERWLDGAENVPGSWWPTWSEWLGRFGGPQVAARESLGNAEFPPGEDAPGSYVRAKAG